MELRTTSIYNVCEITELRTSDIYNVCDHGVKNY